MPNILLVEDDKTIQLALEYALTRADYSVTVASDGIAGLEAARSSNPSLILLDVMLPRLSGLEVARELRGEGNSVPIIMLTALDEEANKIAGLDAGADDYVTKPFSTAELLARVRANLRRGARDGAPSMQQIEVGDLVIDTERTAVTLAGKRIKLRQKEYDLLVALASRPGALCTRQWLTETVWGEPFLSTSRTLDTHVRRLRKALEQSAWSYIHTEHGMGYRFDPVLRSGEEGR